MPEAFPSPSARTYRDLQVAVRQGDSVVIRRLHPSVPAAVASATAARDEALQLSKPGDASSLWEKVDHRELLSRDTFRVCAALFGIAAAIWLSGEIISISALTMLSLLPAIMFVAKAAESTARLEALRVNAAAVERLRLIAAARRRWLVTANRATHLLVRAIGNANALYERPSFGPDGRVIRRQAVDVAGVAQLQQALTRARKVDSFIQLPGNESEIDIAAVARDGWSLPVFYGRPALFAAGVAAAGNAGILAMQHRGIAALVAGLVASALLGVRWAISAREVRRVERTVQRLGLRLRYPDLLTEIDEVIEHGVEDLLAVYATGLDVTIDVAADIEPQLRRQIETAVAKAGTEQSGPVPVIDVRDVHEPSEPNSN